MATDSGVIMNNCSSDCVYDYYEPDTNYGECMHPDFNPDKPDVCPGYRSKEDARADAKLRYEEKG